MPGEDRPAGRYIASRLCWSELCQRVTLRCLLPGQAVLSEQVRDASAVSFCAGFDDIQFEVVNAGPFLCGAIAIIDQLLKSGGDQPIRVRSRDFAQESDAGLKFGSRDGSVVPLLLDRSDGCLGVIDCEQLSGDHSKSGVI